MAVAVFLLVLFAAAVWAVTRSARKLKTALIGFVVMIATGLIAFAAILLSFPHASRSAHTLALNGSISAVVAAPIAVVAGAVAVLIAAAKFWKPFSTEVGR